MEKIQEAAPRLADLIKRAYYARRETADVYRLEASWRIKVYHLSPHGQFLAINLWKQAAINAASRGVPIAY
jgi:hypothetical protein